MTSHTNFASNFALTWLATCYCYSFVSSYNDVPMASLCIENCTCKPMLAPKSLVINCVGRRLIGNDSTLFNEEVDKFFTGRETELTQLAIINSPMQVVPSSICRLSRLVQLSLNLNQLTKLPERCFNKLVELEEFNAPGNFITEIQEGVFDGMRSLKLLNLCDNRISAMGLNVFAADKGLVSLRDINLSNNLLAELEPWPLIRGQLVPGSDVNLMSNRVVNFTNRIGWSFRCGTKPHVSMALTLNDNKFNYVTDLVNGWNITGEKDQLRNIFCFLFSDTPHSRALFNLTLDVHTCDCKDFYFYQLFRFNNHMTLFDDKYCQAPPNLDGDKINTVARDLTQFVCVVEPPVCPIGCECIKIPANRTYIVRSSTVDDLPMSLPDTSHPGPLKCHYALDFVKSKITVVDHRDYFNNTIRLDVSGSSINYVTDAAWRSLVKVKLIDFSFNNLTVIPKVLLSENLTFHSIALYGNPWRCHCEDRWIRTWMTSLGERLVHSESVLCDVSGNQDAVAGKSILTITDEQLCYDPTREQIIGIIKTAVPAAGGSILLVVLLLTAIYRYRVSLFIRINLHPFDVDECQGEDMLYDVFLSCAYEDGQVGRKIVERLEQGDVFSGGQGPAFSGGYKVCYHERDFVPGSLITENIQRAIGQSKRVMCLLTSDFLRSDYCMMEFRAAWNQCLRLGKRRLVVVKWPDVNEETLLMQQPTAVNDAVPLLQHEETFESLLLQSATVDDVKLFLSTYTYIDYEKTDWWQQLIYALATSRILQTQQQ